MACTSSMVSRRRSAYQEFCSAHGRAQAPGFSVMMSWFQALLPKEDRFFDLFEQHGATLDAGARTLRHILEGGDATFSHCAALTAHEHEADLVTREVLLTVRRTFITPFDRSDIRDLITSMDDAIDQMHKTAKAIRLYEQTRFTPDMTAIGDIIIETTALTLEALPLLRNMRGNAARLNAITEKVTQLEELSDQHYDKGIAALYHGEGGKDPLKFIVGSRIYEHLEKIMDRFEDVANEISGLLIEQL